MNFIQRFLNRGQTDPTSRSGTVPTPGRRAPDFALPATTGGTLSLASFRGQPVVLIFYPADNSPVCSNQLALYDTALPLFEEHDAQLLAISTDDLNTHRTFAGRLNLRVPLLADSDPTGAVSKAYGVFDTATGTSQRALFVLDDEGCIHWSQIVPGHINPGAEGVLRALAGLTKETKRSAERGA